jgi:hypothetical protein
MKKNILIVLFCSMLFTVKGFAQITGEVKESNKLPVSGAAVILLAATDTVPVKTTVTDSTGKYFFNSIPAGTYFVSIKVMGYNTITTAVFTLTDNDKNIRLPLITLRQPTKETLGGVTVTAKKPAIERRADKTIVNVDAMISSAGSNALELLEKAPGVQVDNNDVISLKGKAGVNIYIDDKPTYLSGADLANYLKSLPASALDKIEVMTTPPAKYDAAGNAGVINIRTKKNKLKGFNGNLTVSYRQGFYGDSRNTFNFNYRKNNVNIFSNISASGGNNFSDLTIQRTYTNDAHEIQSGFSQNTYIKRWYNSFSGKLGMDFSAGKRTTLGIVLNATDRPSTEHRTNTGMFTNAQGMTDSIIQANNNEKEKFNNKSINLNYRLKIDTTGTELGIDADYVRYKTGNDQLYKNRGLNADYTVKSTDDLIGYLPSYLNIYSFKSDYTHPLNKKSRVEAGVKTSYISTDNNAMYYTSVNNITAPDYEKTNHFFYKENINAAYFNYSIEMKHFSLQAGLRAENTVSKGHQTGNAMKPDSAFKKSYTNIFPTVFASYKPDSAGNNQFNFSYSKRIDRPYYQDLNPFISPLDKYTYYAGNPFLKPQFTQHFELSHIYKNILNTTLFYDNIKDEMGETIELSGNIFISRTGNISKKNLLGFSTDATVKLSEWWSVLPYAQYVYKHTRSRIYTEEVNTKAGSWFGSLTSRFTFTKGWTGEILGRFRSPELDGQFKLGATGNINAGVQKKFMKDKASVKMNVQDIFRTRINKGDITGLKNGSGYYHNQGDSRALVISFSYRFSKGAKSSESQKTGGAESEQNRVKN